MTEHPNTTDREQQAPPTAVEPHGPEGWSAALIALVTSPQRSFEIIRHRAPWLGVLVLLVASAASLNLLATPFGLQAARAQLTEVLADPQQVDAIVSEAEQTAAARWWLTLGTGVVTMIFRLAIQTLFVWILATALRGRARFVQALSLMVYLNLITHLQQWANFLLLHVRGMDAIRSLQDLQTPMGLDLLLTGESALLNAVYASVNPFTIWFLALLGLGAAAVLRLPQRTGWVLAGIYWAASTVLSGGVASVMARILPT